jgi:hypothetical protein
MKITEYIYCVRTGGLRGRGVYILRPDWWLERPRSGRKVLDRNNTLAKHGTKTSKCYTTEFDLEEGFLNGACISIYNLPENIA